MSVSRRAGPPQRGHVHFRKGSYSVQRAAAAVRNQALGQDDRQVFFRDRHRPARLAVDDRDRRAPVALARDTPIAQAVLHLLVAQTFELQVSGDRIGGSLVAEAVVLAGIHADATLLIRVPLLPVVERKRFARNGDDLLDWNPVLLREREIPLVVRRHAHHRAFAVAHQHVVADPHRDAFAGQRMRDREPGRHAFLLHRCEVRFGQPTFAALVDKRGDVRTATREPLGKRMLGGNRHEGHAHDGVGARGEDSQQLLLAVEFVREAEVDADALADPVLLHRFDLRRPVELLQVSEQFFCVLRDAEVVTGDFALLDDRVRTPATAVDDLFVGKHRLVHRVPVDDLGLAVGDALVEHPQEHPLVPSVVLGLASRQFARPVEGEPQRLHLRLHLGDVAVGPLRGRNFVLDRGVLRRQTERVPAHRRHDVVPAHPQDAVHHVIQRVVAHVPHVQLAARVRQHRADIELGLGPAARILRVLDRAIRLPARPVSLCGSFHGLRFVLRFHRALSI